MKLNFTLFVLFFTSFIYSQTSIIKGTVIEEKTGQPLPGVTVTIKSINATSISDLNGNYIFRNLEVGKFDIECSAISFQTKLITEVETLKNDVIVLNINMEEASSALDEVVIKTTRMKAESIKTLLVMQKNSINVSDGISAETIRRTPDKNTSDVLKRISGASIQDNKFVVVRGLNDRYNTALLNGAPLPSSEPDRKAFSFDIFPSNMIDNLVITKTATPDLPGEFAGGIIQINTRSIPDKSFHTLSIGGGYNTITTGKNQIYYEGGSTDWIGIDDGGRALPSQIPDYFSFQSLDALQRSEFAKYVNSDWSLKNKNFSPNISLQYATGQRFDIKDKTLGVLFSVSYSKSNAFTEWIRNDYEYQGDDALPSILDSDYVDQNYSEQYLLGGLANFSLKLNANNTISFKNIYSINSNDRVIERNGAPQEALSTNPLQTYSTVRWFTSNRIYSGQLNGDHFFPDSRIKLNWLGSYSKVSRSIPNMRRNIYTYYKNYNDPDNPNPNDLIKVANIAEGNGGPDYGGGMFFSENNENSYNAKIDLSHKLVAGAPDEIKFGIYMQNRDRDFFARQLQYNKLNYSAGGSDIRFDDNLLNLTDDNIFSPQNIGEVAPNVGGYTLFDATKYFDAYTASSELQSVYLMSDNTIKKLRVIWGFRVENYRQKLDTKLNEFENLKVDNYQLDFLPSVNFIYALNKTQNLRLSYSKTVNRPEFRELAPFGFYDFETQFFTNGTPELQIANVQNGDFRYEMYPGKGQLLSVSAFYKEFKNPIELIAGANNKEVKYRNAKAAQNYGVEMEFRTLLGALFNTENRLANNLTVFSNLAVIKSEIDVSNIESGNKVKQRPLQGQSPYVFNAGMQYLDSESGWSLSMNVNRVGNRIAVVGNDTDAEPTLWEKGRTMLDAQLSKTFLKKKLEIRFNLQNLLNQKLIFYQNKLATNPQEVGGIQGFVNNVFTGDKQNQDGYDSSLDDLVWSTKNGTTFSLTMSYNF